MAVSTIGTTGDYATIALWEDATDIALTEIEEGQLQNETHTLSAQVSFAGTTNNSASLYRKLSCVSGASFRDNASVQSNALRYNASNGAAITSALNGTYPLSVDESFFRIEGIQAQNTHATGGVVLAVSAASAQVDFCIFEGSVSSTNLLQFSNSVSGHLFRNSLVVQRYSAAARILSFSFSGGLAVNVTFVVPSDLTAVPNAFANSGPVGGGWTFKNCAFFNVDALAAVTYTTCYSNELASPPGPEGVTAVSYATQFQNTADSTRDFRLKSGADMIDSGTTDTTNAANDIAGTARPAGGVAYDVGAWEFVSGGLGRVVFRGS
jgi:hypothetical protein